jgi:hypothetical protein
MARGHSAERDLLMAEYATLKSKQQMRIGTRDNLLYATMAALAGVLTVTFTARQPACLLLAGLGHLGWTYLMNDAAISAIGRYIRTELASRPAALTGATGPVLGWETAHRADPGRAVRKTGQLADARPPPGQRSPGSAEGNHLAADLSAHR